MAETTTNNSILGDLYKGSTEGSTITFPTADYTQPDTGYGWADHIRQQKETCNAKQGCEWDSENERCNCYSDLTTGEGAPSPCDTASCPEGYTCKENANSPAGYDCISDAEYADTLEGYLDTVDLGGFCQGATSDITDRGEAGCKSAGGTWVDYESFFGADYYKKISETFGFGEDGDDYSEFFPGFPVEKFEEVLGKLPEYEGEQQALINRAFGAATNERKRQQALIEQAFEDGLIGVDERDELLKGAFALQSVAYEQKIGTERYKARIAQAYDEGIISVEEKNQLLSSVGDFEGNLQADMNRKLDVELEKKKQSLGGIQRQFQTSVSQLRGSLMGALPGIDEALGTQFAGSGYAKTAEQRVYEQSQDAFSNIIANTYIPEFEDIKSRYNLTTGQIKEETKEAMEQAYLKFAGDELATDEAEQSLRERDRDIKFRKQQLEAGLLTDAERDQLARDEAALNLRDEMDKRISEVDSILYDWLGQTLRQAGLTAEGIEEPEACPEGQKECSDSSCVDEDEDCPPDTDVVIDGRTTDSCNNQCQQVVDNRSQWETKGYTSIDECVKGCAGGDDGFVTYYSCVDKECVADAAGEYTSDDCDGKCDERKAFSCQNGACTPDPEGNFETEQACIDSGCTAQPYDCQEVNGELTCVEHFTADAADYESLADCEAGCGGGGCENDTECDDGYKCVDGTCVEDECTNNTDCEDCFACDDGTCVEVEGCCVDDADCGTGKCIDNECVDECENWCSAKPEMTEAGVWVDKIAGGEWLKSRPTDCKAEDCGKVPEEPEKPPKDIECGPEPTFESICGDMQGGAGMTGCMEKVKRLKAKWDACMSKGKVTDTGPVTPVTPRPPSARYGANFITSGPQNIMVGDNPGGRELVQVTPLGSPNTKGPKSFLDQLYKNKMNYSFNQNSILEDLYK